MKTTVFRYIRSVISLVLVLVMVVGMAAVPAQAVATSVTPRLYADLTTSAAYGKYTEFAELYVPQYSTAIPGLTHTDINGRDCTTMVPQGLCVTEEYMIISAHASTGRFSSVLYVLSNTDPENRQFLTTVVLPTKARISGVAFDGTYLWVSNGRYVSTIDYSTLISVVNFAVAGKKKSVPIRFHSTCVSATQGDLLTYSDGMLWVGQTTEMGDTTGKLYGYTVSQDGKKLTQKYYVNLPDRVRGICFQDGCLIMSRSSGRNAYGSDYLSELRIYQLSEPDSSGMIRKSSVVKTIPLPPMAVALAAGNTYLYSLYESAASQYYLGIDGGGKCKYPVDRVTAFALSEVLEGAGSDQTFTPACFPACDEDENDFADALSSMGYDSTMATRTKIAQANGILDYTGTAEQNDVLLKLMRAGALTNPGISVMVDAPAVVTLDVNAVSLSVGKTTQISAVYSQGSVSWKSSNTRVATVSVVDAHTVSVKALHSGKATITCTLSNGKIAKCVITVTAEYFAACGAEETSLANALAEQNYDDSMETRSKIAVANDISNYTGTAAQDRTLLSLMKAGKLVNPALPLAVDAPAKVALDQTVADVNVGQTIRLTALYPEGTVLWKSSNTKVATVSQIDTDTAVVTALGAGKATVTCLLSNGSFAKCVIKVTNVYFAPCSENAESITHALSAQGYDTSVETRAMIAAANGITGYTGTTAQNDALLKLMREGKLINPSLTPVIVPASVYYEPCDDSYESIASALRSLGADGSWTFRTKIAAANGIAGYTGTAEQNVQMLDLLKAGKLLKPDIILGENEFLVCFNANGGTGTMENTVVTYGTNTILRTPAFTREGYSLSGWYRYRTSDNKWYYTSADGKTSAWYVEGSQPSGYKKNVIKTTSGVSKTSSVDGDVVIMYAVWKQGESYASLDGKKVLFIGNSMIYYGGAVETGGQKKTDTGWFYEICKANGEDVTVYDCTYGNHHLYDFSSKGCKSGSCHNGKDLLSGVPLSSIDYVFLSESGNNNANFLRDVKAIMKRFPSSTKFFYLSHAYTYFKNHTKITKNLSALQKLGVGVVEWGKLVDDVIDGKVKVPGATVKYNKNSFIKNKGDTHHPNPLSGYITAQMAYCAVTGRSAVGQMPDVYKIGNTVKYGKSVVGYSAFISKHYKSASSSNFKKIMNSKADIKGLQKLMDQYLAKWKLGIDG